MIAHDAIALECNPCGVNFPNITDALTPCPNCGGRLTRPGESASVGREIDLVRVARAQRSMIVVLLFCIVFQIIGITGTRLFDGAPWWLGHAFSLAAYLVSMVFTFQLLTALRTHLAARILIMPLMLLSCAGLVIMLVINQRATTQLKAAGVRVGLLGANVHDADAAMDPSRCRGCGYSLIGNITNVCPECGLEVPASARAVERMSTVILPHAVGALLATPVPCELPAACVKCGGMDQLKWYNKTFSWHPSWYYVLLISPMIYVIAALIGRRKARVKFALCGDHARRRALCILVNVVAVCAAALVFVLSSEPETIAITIALTLLFVAVTIIIMQPLRPTAIDAQLALFKGASPAFLALLSATPVTTFETAPSLPTESFPP